MMYKIVTFLMIIGMAAGECNHSSFISYIPRLLSNIITKIATA
jgi:hypothetical protein